MNDTSTPPRKQFGSFDDYPTDVLGAINRILKILRGGNSCGKCFAMTTLARAAAIDDLEARHVIVVTETKFGLCLRLTTPHQFKRLGR